MKKIKVFFEASSMLVGFGGIPVFAKNVLRNLSEIPDIELHTGFSVFNIGKHLKYRKQVREITDCRCEYHPHFVPGRFANRIPFAKYRADKYDFMHFSTHTVPTCCVPTDFSNTILTIHDMFLWHSEYQIDDSDAMRKIKDSLPIQAEKSRAIVTISEFSRQEIHKYAGIPLEKIYAVPLAAQWTPQAFLPSEVLRNNGLSAGGYFLSVSALLPHKNYEALFLAFQKYSQSSEYAGEKLVVTGAKKDFFADICRLLDETPNVVHLENVPENDLRTLYENCRGFFLVSKIEGFGIPLLEAMGCKVPACYGLGSAMDEIGRDAAWGVDPGDIDKIAEMFARFSAGGNEVNRRVEKAWEISREYSYRKTAEAYCQLYKRLLDG